MKKILYSILSIAAVAITACQPKEAFEAPAEGKLIPLTITAELPATRTFIQETDNGWQPYWNAQDSIYVNPLIDNDYAKQYKFVNAAGEGTTGSFSGSIEAAEGAVSIYAHRPKKAARSGAIFKFDIASEQTIDNLGTFDTSCDVLISDKLDVTVENQKAVTSDKLHFHRVMAIAKVSLTDATTSSKLSGKKIKSVKLTSSSATLSGRVRVNVTSAAIDGWESAQQYNYVGASYSGTDWTADSNSGAFIIMNPVTLASGSTLTLEATTDDPAVSITRDVKLGSDIKLETGKIATLNFRIADSDVFNPSEVGEPVTWDFSEAEWQAQFAKLGSATTELSAVSLVFADLSIEADAKSKYGTSYFQPCNPGSTDKNRFKFSVTEAGTVSVIESHTGSTAPDPIRSIVVSNNGVETSIEGSVNSKVQKTCEFNVTPGDVYVWGTGAARYYKIIFTPGKTVDPVDPDDPDDPDNPAESAELECTNPPATGTVDPTKMYGFAEAGGVTGGEGATGANVLHFNDGKALQTWLLARAKSEGKKYNGTPTIIWLSGTFGPDDGRDFSEAHPWFDVKEVSNISFYGIDSFVMDRIGLFLVRSKNIIIRNINFQQPKANNGADAISMQDSEGVWVDHCTFTSLNQTKDYEDGSTDITHASKNVTVSWCRYIKTQKSCLVGHSNSASADAAITATFHHNWFDGSSSRHPRVRFGWAHVYNNLYDGCTTYGAGSAYGAKVLVEYNYFDAVQLPTDICTYPAKESNESNLQGSVAGYLYPTENVYVNRPDKAKDPYPLSNIKYTSYNGTTITPLTYNDFKPSYNYVVTPAADVPAVVKANAGYGKLGWSEAPVAVNNGGVSGYNGSDDNPTDPDPDDPDNPDQPAAGLSEGWSWVNNGATATYSVASDGKLSIASTGKWESKAQTFGMAYREVSGDFTATVKLVSYTPQKSGSNQAVAGLMLVGSNVSDTATDLLFTIVGNVYVNSRIEKGKDKAGASLTAPSGSGGDTILRLVREGSKVKMSYSLDGGATFSSISSKEFVSPLPDSVKIGLGVNSGDNSKQSTAVFADFKINDTKIDF
ncbi:MAG: polysaccharide lyase family 1 protein [Bacteroidales bacterium]|nr:polysaccharide lyase family 1 protein [Bacteroidales bacterium]